MINSQKPLVSAFCGLVLVATLLFVGCSSENAFEQRKIESVYIEPSGELFNYYVFYRDGSELVTIRVYSQLGDNQKVRVFMDVPPESNMWFEARSIRGLGYFYYLKFDIHIRNKEDLELKLLPASKIQD
jgi:hypothetical protein